MTRTAIATADAISNDADAQWTRLPTLSDPRIPFAVLLLTYLILGVTVLGFNRDPWQIAGTVAFAIACDMLLHRWLRPTEPMLFPLSAAISGMGLSILLNYAHGSLWPGIVVAITIASKYLVTFNNRHIFNPTLFGIVLSLLFAQDMVSPAPAYQWGGEAAFSIFVITAALVFFVIRINRLLFTASFLIFYGIALVLRAWLVRWHVPPEMLFLGALTAPSFYLFVFFMLPDPATSPGKPKMQVIVAAAIVIIDLLLHFKQSVNTHFYAAFLVAAIRFQWSHGAAMRRGGYDALARLRIFAKRLGYISLLVIPVTAFATLGPWVFDSSAPSFRFVQIETAAAGISSRQGAVLDEVDPRIAHIAKWVLSIGDAVAISDVDNDGFQDVFLTYPL
ncbi:MAG TPA: hypothetical protein VM532_04360, partial [Burkholderiales bacterium]|nr:hypothetical protein [Burkholderiales bacterium]